MDNFDRIFNLTNYRDHPENKDYVVFFFYLIEQGRYFDSLLLSNGIDYESFEETDGKPKLLFAVRKRDFKEALKLNELSYAQFKKPFITNKWLKYSVLLTTLFLVLFAIWGYFKTHFPL